MYSRHVHFKLYKLTVLQSQSNAQDKTNDSVNALVDVILLHI